MRKKMIDAKTNFISKIRESRQQEIAEAIGLKSQIDADNMECRSQGDIIGKLVAYQANVNNPKASLEKFFGARLPDNEFDSFQNFHDNMIRPKYLTEDGRRYPSNPLTRSQRDDTPDFIVICIAPEPERNIDGHSLGCHFMHAQHVIPLLKTALPDCEAVDRLKCEANGNDILYKNTLRSSQGFRVVVDDAFDAVTRAASEKLAATTYISPPPALDPIEAERIRVMTDLLKLPAPIKERVGATR